MATIDGATANPGDSSGPLADPPATPQVVNPNPPEAGRLTEEMIRLNHDAASATGVVPAIHPQDFIYWFCCRHPQQTLESAISYYFSDGANSAEKLDGIVTELGFEPGQAIELLEFASGYGCVTRHLKKHARWDVTSCDIHSEAIDFLDQQIGVKILQSARLPEQFATIKKYDVVFALSFFSHMPRSTFGRWLRALYGTLRAPGYLIFTTHGVKSCPCFGITPDDIPADGFLFRANSEQEDLDVVEYGSTLSTPDFVIKEIYRHVGAPIAMYKQAGWWGHQDLWVVKKNI